jgi:hypothetical protein
MEGRSLAGEIAEVCIPCLKFLSARGTPALGIRYRFRPFRGSTAFAVCSYRETHDPLKSHSLGEVQSMYSISQHFGFAQCPTTYEQAQQTLPLPQELN